MPDVLDPTATPPVPADDTTELPPRPHEAIMAEVRALGKRIRDPNTPPAEVKALRLYILRELMPEMSGTWTPEDEALDREMMRSIDSRRPPGQKLFEHILGKEAS